MSTKKSGSGDVLDRATFRQRAEALLPPLLDYARRELRANEALGLLPCGAVTPDDIVDTVLMEALDQLERVPARRLYPWLRVLVRRTIRREVAAAHRMVSLEKPVRPRWWKQEEYRQPPLLHQVVPDPSSPIPDRVVESREFQRALTQILHRLPARVREPFLLHVRDGLPLSEVARLEQAPVSEVSRRIRAARRFLRDQLAEEYENVSVLPPTEEIFTALERVEPTPQQVGRFRQRLETSAA